MLAPYTLNAWATRLTFVAWSATWLVIEDSLARTAHSSDLRRPGSPSRVYPTPRTDDGTLVTDALHLRCSQAQSEQRAAAPRIGEPRQDIRGARTCRNEASCKCQGTAGLLTSTTSGLRLERGYRRSRPPPGEPAPVTWRGAGGGLTELQETPSAIVLASTTSLVSCSTRASAEQPY